MQQTILLQLVNFILLSFIFNSFYIRAELILNPGQNSIITCGENEACNIICNETQICAGSIFNVYNTVTIECSGEEACKNTTINTANINSLHALFNGESSFVQSQFISTTNDKSITINCNALYACELAEFSHYSNTMTHICSGEKSCAHTFIHSGYNSASSIICNATKSCSGVCDNFLDPCSDRCKRLLVGNSFIKTCPDTQISIASNDIYVECSDTKSCNEVPFNVYNFTSLHMVLNGESTFQKSIVTATSNKPNSIIDVICLSDGCEQAEFNYSGTALVYHSCAFYFACDGATIRAETVAQTILNCNETSSCILLRAVFKYGVNKLLCSGLQACDGAEVVTHYVEWLSVEATGKDSFDNAEIITHSSDNNITVICDGESSCYQSKYYYNVSGTVIQKCNGKFSCYSAGINAFVGISLICNGDVNDMYTGPCLWMVLNLMTFDINEFNKFKLTIVGSVTSRVTSTVIESWIDPFIIHSLFGMKPEQIICIDCTYTDIVIVYGVKFNTFCWLSDGCLDNIMADIEYQPSDIQITNEYQQYQYRNWTKDSLDYRAYNVNKQHVVIILAKLPGLLSEWNSIIYPPQMNSDDSWVSILCLDNTCSGLDIDMRSTKNAALTLSRFSRLNNPEIYASSNYFIYNVYKSSNDQNLYLNNTNYVQLNGVSKIEIFAGNVLNLELRCIEPFYDCALCDLYSSINPMIIPVFKSGWNFQCDAGKCMPMPNSWKTYAIDIHFTTINTDCSYSSQDPDCSFLSFDPTVAPTVSPTYSPSVSPTYSPSNAPTLAPTVPPTRSPTRYPTLHDAYSKKIRIDYTFSGINKNNIEILSNDMQNIILIIEQSYIIIAKHFANSNNALQYRHFEIRVNYNNMIKRSNTLMISTNFYYEDNSKSTIIELVTRTTSFQSYAQSQFQQQYHNPALLFTANVVEIDETVSETFDYILIVFIGIMFIGVFISIAAFIHNKSSKSIVDDATHVAVVVYALQVCDFISDIALSVEILSQFTKSSNDFKIPLYIAGYGSIFFVVLPYMVNVFLIFRIQKYVSQNSTAVIYFQQRSALFVILVILCGGTYATLNIVSSRLFGYEILNSGLSAYELRQLSNLKLFGNVLLENVPQLIMQIIYIGYMGTVTNTTGLSFFASSMSICAALLTWFLQRKSSESFVIQYDLEMVKKNKAIMSETERKAIIKKKECKKSLRRLITANIKIPETAIELGSVTMTATGCVIHCIHYCAKSELKKFIDNSNNSIPMIGNDEENTNQHLYINASKQYVRQIYVMRKYEVNDAFIQHFNFKSNGYHVKYMEKFGYNNLISKKNIFAGYQLTPTPAANSPANTINVNEYEGLDSVDFQYHKIISLGIMIKDLLKNDMNYRYIKEILIEQGHQANAIDLWLKWYKIKQDKEDNINNSNTGSKIVNISLVASSKGLAQISQIENDEIENYEMKNEIEIEMQTVLNDKGNNKYATNISETFASAASSSSLKRREYYRSESASDSDIPYARNQSFKL